MDQFNLSEKNVVDLDGILIVGAGLVGSLAAVTLSQRGHNVVLVERSEDWEVVSESDTKEEQEKSTLKRSINLALSVRGQKALENVGLLDEVLKFTIPMYGRAIHTGGNISPQADSFQPYDEIDSSNFIKSVSREKLNKLLVSKARSNKNVQVLFGLRLSHVDKDGVAHFEDRATSMKKGATFNDFTPGRYRIKPKLVLGCDGAYSATRESMLRLQTMNFERKYISHGYKELCIPATDSGEFALDQYQSLHIWPRGDFMMIGLPNPDKTFTCTIFAPFHSEKNSHGKVIPGLLDIKTDDQIKEYFKTYFPDAISVMPDFVDQFKRNPSCRLVTVKAEPWNMKDKILIIGDAAHAMVPFYGQGMNSGFEDVLDFDETLQRVNNNVSIAVEQFSTYRQPQGVAIAQLSLRNYMEMRHHTGSKLFLARKKFEGVLNYLFPKSWVPLYKMVAFTRIPYAEAIQREEVQQRIITASVIVGAISVATASLCVLKGLFGNRCTH